MLDEAKQLQNDAVNKLVSLIGTSQKEITFKAPTGSGKTHMMADFMDRVLSVNSNVVFIVSSLSKAELAKQNYEAFCGYIAKGKFRNLNPYLIKSVDDTEGALSIPEDNNVYILPRDLYKKESILMKQATLLNFLIAVRMSGKVIYVIKDECHINTSNLDSLNDFFVKVVNFSATPDIKKKQIPDVEISTIDAVNAHLIKKVVDGSQSDSLEDALNKFVEIKKDYLNHTIGVNPCMIIQISNKDKADEEIKKIKNTLSQLGFSDLKWMLILDDSEKKSETNDILGIKKQPMNRWKYYAKLDNSTIDIIIFKMVISEGWDIRRACMLYQVRDSQSKQLDEQVVGRVRRNPRLLDFETLSKEAQDLISTAYVWGVRKEDPKFVQLTMLFGDELDNEIQNEVKIQTTRLMDFDTTHDVDIDSLSLAPVDTLSPLSIFDLYREYSNSTVEVRKHFKDYVDSPEKFFKFTNNIAKIKKEINNTCCDYQKYVAKTTDSDGEVYEVSFPYESSYTPTDFKRNLDEWVWSKKSDDKFSFDSESEEEWIHKLLSREVKKYIKVVNVGGKDEILLVGKNFLENSEIKYEYYSSGRHFSYPDFVLKDIYDRIHIFEVKSLNMSNSLSIDSEEYRDKVSTLKDFYTEVSRKVDHYFYLPIKHNNEWHVWVMKGGICEHKTFDEFVEIFRNV
ncbi:MAG: DEAD/DEAH box helicase family protein [Paludibacteraceae bacterium]|nr:DEAD/DEAH box helicase family protein [Paludibacteraceae bacterium]